MRNPNSTEETEAAKAPLSESPCLTDERRRRIERALHQVSRILSDNGISIFFSNEPGHLWVDGEEWGTIDHDHDGTRFEVVSIVGAQGTKERKP